MKTPVYIAPEVAQVSELHPYLADSAFMALPIREQIAMQARTLHAAHEAGDARIGMHVMCWWPGSEGLTLDEVLTSEFSDADAGLTMCREYGFSDWNAVESSGDLTPNPAFEQALEEMLAGKVKVLRSQLDQAPQLAKERSRYGHQSTLLHYLGANGVESHRQRTPLNAATMAALLISRGASKKAEANMYGGGQTPYALARTSAHPHNAGISDQLNRALQTV